MFWSAHLPQIRLRARALPVLAALAIFALALGGCGAANPGMSSGGSSTGGSGGGGGGGGGGASAPPFSHVFVVVEENHRYSQVIGSTDMPYLNSLAQQYGLATQYFANTHPSIGNYFMLTTGQIVTNDDNFVGPVSVDDVNTELEAAGLTWKCYAESLPSVGYLGPDSFPYSRHHDPFTYFSEVQSSVKESDNIVPFTQFQSDMANNALPGFSFIVPNLLDDAHDGSLAAADQWLQTNIQPLIASADFQKNGLLIITFDESLPTDTTMGGGQVATVIVSGKSKQGYQSVTVYQHPSTLRLILEALGVSKFPAAAATAPDMSEFFQPSTIP